MANAFIVAVIMIKGKSLYDGFSCFNHNEVTMNGLDVQLSWSSKGYDLRSLKKWCYMVIQMMSKSDQNCKYIFKKQPIDYIQPRNYIILCHLYLDFTIWIPLMI